MGSVTEIFVALALIVGIANFPLKMIHDKARKLAVEKIQQGQPSLAAYSQKLTGRKIIWDERSPNKKFQKFTKTPISKTEKTLHKKN